MVIGRGRRREHPNDTSEGGSRNLRSIQVLHNFRLRMRTPKGTLKGSSDLWSHPVAMLLLLRKSAGKTRACAEHTSGQGLLRSRD
jgi:hypothetical protein